MRRAPRLLALLALLALIASATVTSTSGAQPYSEWVHYRRLDLSTPWGERRVLVTLPRRSDHREHPPGERYPILIALHGRGEALQGPERGHLGWATRYGLPDAFGALQRGRLAFADYRRYVREPHLDYVNQSLRAEPFRGMLVVTPYVPDLGSQPLRSEAVTAYVDWLAGPLVDAVRERFEGAATDRGGVGIDGVSLGGRVALEAGFRHPEVFGAVGATQPAIRGHSDGLAEMAASGRTEASAQQIRLLSSDEDPFLGPTRRLSTGLRLRRMSHTLTVMPGPHDYGFNRGPGVLEMLLWHDRALTRAPMPE